MTVRIIELLITAPFKSKWSRQAKLLLVVLFLILPIQFGALAVAQKYYSFEEACRRAGRTTGACAPKLKQNPLTVCLRFGGNAFHAEKFSSNDCTDVTLSPVIDSEIFVEMIGLPNIPKVNELKLTIGRSIDFNNAAAFFHNGSRWIVYDPEWAKKVTAESYLILAHEAGHHFCGHTLENVIIGRQESELEADQFSGASIKRFEIYHGKAFLEDALKVAAQLYSALGSRTHPPRAARVEAVMLGYNSGSPCGNLAPGIRGFSRQRR